MVMPPAYSTLDAYCPKGSTNDERDCTMTTSAPTGTDPGTTTTPTDPIAQAQAQLAQVGTDITALVAAKAKAATSAVQAASDAAAATALQNTVHTELAALEALIESVDPGAASAPTTAPAAARRSLHTVYARFAAVR